MELMNRSCLSNASASEQLGPESSSFTREYRTKRVITFRVLTVSYSLDAGCFIFSAPYHNDLSRGLRVSEIHPIQRGFVSAECRLWQSLQQVPQVYPGFDVVRTSDCDIGQMIVGSPSIRSDRCPAAPSSRCRRIIYPGDKALRLVLSRSDGPNS